MSQPTPGQHGAIIARLAAPPTVDSTPGGGSVATLRVTIRDTEEYVLIAFGSLVQDLRALEAGCHIYAEGRWQAREGRPSEMIVSVLTSLTRNRPIS